MEEKESQITTIDLSSLRQFTAARIVLGRTGSSIPVKEILQFKMAHAHARDAVFSLLNKEAIIDELTHLQLPYLLLKSKATDRHIYLQRPDLGRCLDEQSIQILTNSINEGFDVCISLADGLSAEAINQHAIAVIRLLMIKLQRQSLRIAPVCIIEGGRVAISDETGSLAKAKLSLMLIGERPGLTSPNSMSAYLTYAPMVGLTDESRNCVSNIHPEGLSYEAAAEKIFYLIKEAFRLQVSGIALKDNESRHLTESKN